MSPKHQREGTQGPTAVGALQRRNGAVMDRGVKEL